MKEMRQCIRNKLNLAYQKLIPSWMISSASLRPLLETSRLLLYSYLSGLVLSLCFHSHWHGRLSASQPKLWRLLHISSHHYYWNTQLLANGNRGKRVRGLGAHWRAAEHRASWNKDWGDEFSELESIGMEYCMKHGIGMAFFALWTREYLIGYYFSGIRFLRSLFGHLVHIALGIFNFVYDVSEASILEYLSSNKVQGF